MRTAPSGIAPFAFHYRPYCLLALVLAILVNIETRIIACRIHFLAGTVGNWLQFLHISIVFVCRDGGAPRWVGAITVHAAFHGRINRKQRIDKRVAFDVVVRELIEGAIEIVVQLSVADECAN